MKRIIVILLVIISQINCKKTQNEIFYIYKGGQAINLPETSSKIYILESLRDSENLVILDNSTYTPSKEAFGFIGFYEKNDTSVKFWGVDTSINNSYLKVALSYFRHFYTLTPKLISLIKNIQSPSATYMLFYLDSISPEQLYKKATQFYENRDSLGETETYYLIKIMYEIKKGIQKDFPLLDSAVNYYIKKWPFGKNSPKLYYYLLSNGKIRQDTMINTYINLIKENPYDPYALQFLAFLADTSIKGNKNRKFLRKFLSSAGRLPVTSTTIQLTFYIPELFNYIDANDTLNIYRRTFINEFGSPAYLIELWSTSDLIGYHFARGYFLKRLKKYDDAIYEFEKCRNYDIPHYYTEESDRQIIDIYKLTGKYTSEECRATALDLISRNPIDTVARNVLGNPSDDSLFSLLKPLLIKKSKPLNPTIKFTLLDGKTLTHRDLRGKSWVIKFWSVYCPHCRREIPFENELYIELKDRKDYGFLACSTNSKDEVKKFLDKNAFYFTQAFGCNHLRKYFRVSGVPAYFVLDKNSNIIFAHIGEDRDIKNRLKTEMYFASLL